LKHVNTDLLKKMVIVFLILILVELLVFNNGNVFLLIGAAVFLYFGISKHNKILIWIAALLIFIAILNVWSLRLFIVFIIFYILYQNYTKEKKEFTIDETNFESGKITKNQLIRTAEEPSEQYKWQDVHGQNFFGDVTFDITQTILPIGTSVISIRQGIGKVTVIIPYEVPFRLQFTTLLGEAKLLHHPAKRLYNEHIIFEDGETENAKRTLVIHIATWLGDVEVIRK
jgi:lia operon protein LiaF